MQSLRLNERSDSSSESKTESLKDARNGLKNVERKRFAEKRKKPKPDDKVFIAILYLLLIVILEEIEAAEEERRKEDARREGIFLKIDFRILNFFFSGSRENAKKKPTSAR